MILVNAVPDNLISALAVITSVGTPAAPGAGAVILFTILSGAGLNNELAMMAYSLVIAINRPVEMLVTALNVVGDSACGIAVARHENAMNLEKYYHMGQMIGGDLLYQKFSPPAYPGYLFRSLVPGAI